VTRRSRRAAGSPRLPARTGPPARRDPGRPPGRPAARDPGAGTLSPRADPVTGALGWQVTTPDRHLAAAAAATCPGGTVRGDGHGHWHARLPGPVLAVTAITAAPAAIRCRLAARPDLGPLTLPLTPWTALPRPGPAGQLPATGQLTIRPVLLTTRTGRTIRYLIPELTPA
jgi:hypothetical protein